MCGGVPRQSTLIESNSDVLMRSNIKSIAGQAQRMTGMRRQTRMSRGGSQKRTQPERQCMEKTERDELKEIRSERERVQGTAEKKKERGK